MTLRQIFVFYRDGIIDSVCEDPFSAQQNDIADNLINKSTELVSIIAPTLDDCWKYVPGIYIPCNHQKVCEFA